MAKLVSWFRKSVTQGVIWDVIKTLFWVPLVTAAFAIWAWLESQPPIIIATIAFAVMVLCFGIITLIRWWLDRRTGSRGTAKEESGFEFYPDRDALNRGRGGIGQEIRSTEQVWVAWSSAAVAESTGGILDNPRLTRLLLIDPASQYIDFHALAFGTSKKVIQDHISQALKQAHESINRQPRTTSQSPIEIKTYSGPMTDTLVIGNPHWAVITGKEAETWVRLETSAPYKYQAKRPSFLITKERYPELYTALFQHYLDMWGDKNLSSSYPKPFTTQSVPDTPDPQPGSTPA